MVVVPMQTIACNNGKKEEHEIETETKHQRYNSNKQ